MFGYNCSFCGCDEKCYSDSNYLCKNCVEIKKIIDGSYAKQGIKITQLKKGNNQVTN